MLEVHCDSQSAHIYAFIRLPWWISGKESSCNAGDAGSIPGLGRSPGGGQQPTPGLLPRESHGQRNLAG